MEKTITELQEIVAAYYSKIKAMHTSEFSAKPNPNKWSKKEVLGHLIDSAQNNLRRFLVGQYEPEPHIVYDQDFWVNANNYRHMADSDVIELWKLMNERIIEVLKMMPVENYNRRCNTGKAMPSHHSLLWLASDYVSHLKHHLNQIIAGSFNITYP